MPKEHVSGSSVIVKTIPVHSEGEAGGVELKELQSALPPDYRMVDTPNGATVGPMGLYHNGEHIVFVDEVGLRLSFTWELDLPGRMIRPHGATYSTLVVGSEDFAKEVADTYGPSILVTAQSGVRQRLSPRLIKLSYTRDLLPWCSRVIWEPKGDTWRRPIAEAQYWGVPISPPLDVKVLDEAHLVLLLDGLTDTKVEYPPVGIAINCYKRPYLVQWAVWSAVNQIYPGKFDVALVEDGSPPEVQEFIGEIVKGMDCENLIYKPLRSNSGVACSWNTALRLLPYAEYLTYTSSDNIQARGHILHLARWAALTRADAVSGVGVFMGDKHRGIFRVGRLRIDYTEKGTALGPSFLVRAGYMHSAGYMRPDFLYVEDTVFSGSMWVRGLNSVTYPLPLYYYRTGHKDSLTHTVRSKWGNWNALLAKHFANLWEEGQHGLDEPIDGYTSRRDRYVLKFSPLMLASYYSWKHKMRLVVVAPYRLHEHIPHHEGLTVLHNAPTDSYDETTRTLLLAKAPTPYIGSVVYCRPMVQYAEKEPLPMADIVVKTVQELRGVIEQLNPRRGAILSGER
jgi:hypothetical protein